MVDYNKKIEGQCGTCRFALVFGPPPSPGESDDGVHCASESLAQRNKSMDEFREYGFSDLYRLESLAEESFRCEDWAPANDQQLFGKTVNCATCGAEHTFDWIMGYDCLVLIDGRKRPNFIWAWCNEACFNHWLDSQEAKELFPTM